MFHRTPLFFLTALCVLVGIGRGNAQVAPRVLSSCEDAGEWAGGTLDREHVKAGKASIRWEHGKQASLTLKQVPADWSAYDRLSFWLYSQKATGSRFLLLLSSENPATEGMDYYSTPITLNFTGWRRFRIYLPGMGASRTPLGWKQIKGLRFAADGWDNTPNPEAVVCLDDLVLTQEGKETGPRMTDEDLFASLNLDYPGLEAVKAAVGKGDLAAAKKALADYYRHRETPHWYFPAGEMANPRPEKPDTARAERVMRHEMESIGYRHQFGPVIDWNYDASTAPDSKIAPNSEWTWQLNRHADWSALARAYRDTGDEKYAREFTAQMTQWVRDCPMPEGPGNGDRSAWRTIETGIRAFGAWPPLFYRFLHSPEFTDEALVTMVKSFAEHALHLMAHHTTGNWLAMEGNGLYHVGVLFPEFKDAPAWRETAMRWLYAELENQVYPDGIQIELASGYHHVSLDNFLGTYRFALLNNVTVPADYLKRLEKMYDFDVFGAMPDRRLPAVQDGGYNDIRGALREGATYFPNRQDFRWYATDGKEGKQPDHTSHAFPYAGYYMMRSGWESDARYLFFDGGPFGYGHQHEDKLNLILHAYGKLLLMDPGVYTYERSKWREFFLDSASHNVVLVDGQPQRRRGRPRNEYVVKQPLPHVWATAPDYDYVEAAYEDGFGGAVGKNVTHTRRILFVKPDYWIMLDTLTAKDGKPHTYDALFHFDTPVQADSTARRLFTGNTDAANLAIVARPDAGLALQVVTGQENPVQGWMPNRDIASVHPAPTAIYRFTGQGVTQFLTVLAPAPKGAPDSVAAVEPVAGDPLAAQIRFRDGRVHRVRFSGGTAADLSVDGFTGRGHAVLVETLADGKPGRRIVAAP